MERWKVNDRIFVTVLKTQQRKYWDIKQNVIIKDGIMKSARYPQ
jgi:hypothetical protein